MLSPKLLEELSVKDHFRMRRENEAARAADDDCR
jgi:hypothetical protein